MPKFYLTTTIPYVNAKPHLGHALEFVEADAIVRAKRLLLGAENVYFLSGSDENAMKNVQAAEAQGITAKELVDRNSALFKDLLSHLNISNDDFIRTTEERHIRGAQALWEATDPKDIYKKTYQGLYCTGCEQFYQPEELNEEGECFEHPGKKLEMVEEENYFFKLSNYTDWLKDLIVSGELRITPDTWRNEMLALLERGLEDFSISRPASRTKSWGVPVPEDEGQTMYVWYDALANYITALGYPDLGGKYQEFWAGNESRGHILGKGVNRFHTIYWPAMLKSAGLPLPTFAYVHGYITVEGQKMSKTVGNVIDPEELVSEYGTDAVRFYLLHEISSQSDGDFSRDRMKEAYNAYLANGIGNLTARILKMAAANNAWPQDLFKDVLVSGADQWSTDLVGKKKIVDYLDKFQINNAIDLVWTFISAMDLDIQESQPFKLIKEAPERGKEKIAALVERLYDIALCLEPFLPETSSKIQIAIKNRELPPVLFPRKA